MQPRIFKEYDVVKVISLSAPSREFTGTEGVMRLPEIGDIGTILIICSDAIDPDPTYTVESVVPGGYTVWLADFLASELAIA